MHYDDTYPPDISDYLAVLQKDYAACAGLYGIAVRLEIYMGSSRMQ